MKTNEEVALNFDELQKEIAQLDERSVREQLTQIKVRQKIQQKRQQEKGSQKIYQAKQREKQRLLKEAAMRLGIYDAVNEEADAIATKKFEEESVEEADATAQV